MVYPNVTSLCSRRSSHFLSYQRVCLFVCLLLDPESFWRRLGPKALHSQLGPKALQSQLGPKALHSQHGGHKITPAVRY